MISKQVFLDIRRDQPHVPLVHDVPELKLELNNHGVNHKGFYDDRTKGRYTPPNREKTEPG